MKEVMSNQANIVEISVKTNYELPWFYTCCGGDSSFFFFVELLKDLIGNLR